MELAARRARSAPESDVTGYMFGDLTTALVAEARHQEDLAAADRARRAAQAVEVHAAGETVWERLRRRVGSAREGQPVPRLQPAAGSPSGS